MYGNTGGYTNTNTNTIAVRVDGDCGHYIYPIHVYSCTYI